jgi:hypothetical protein
VAGATSFSGAAEKRATGLTAQELSRMVKEAKSTRLCFMQYDSFFPAKERNFRQKGSDEVIIVRIVIASEGSEEVRIVIKVREGQMGADMTLLTFMTYLTLNDP